MIRLNEEKASNIVGGAVCWGKERPSERTKDGRCIFDTYCVKTDKYGNPDLGSRATPDGTFKVGPCSS